MKIFPQIQYLVQEGSQGMLSYGLKVEEIFGI
jgi:hypothetical protein